jgi:lipopolysaccharide biosynthesis glycosyltransferase
MIQVYAGFDEREAVGYHTFCASVIEHCTEPVSISPLNLKALQKVYHGGQRDGTNAFIYSRFLIPYLQKFSGWALFVDGADMIVKDDLAKLWAMRDPYKAVQVVKHDYKTKHPRKYIGTSMESPNEDYPCKNWSSVMLINCQHYGWRHITPSLIETVPGSHLHRFQFLEDRYVGELPAGWNHLADEMGQNDDAKLLHWTAGIPAWAHYKDAPHAVDWFHAHEKVNHAC